LITTSVSLLYRLQQGANSQDWQRFVHLYTPLLLRWARRAGAQDADAADLAQDVLLLLVHKLPMFDHKGPQSFRSWLRTLLLNKWRDLCRYRAARPAQTDGATLKMALTRNGDLEEQEDREDRLRLVALGPTDEITTWVDGVFVGHGRRPAPSDPVPDFLTLVASCGSLWFEDIQLLHDPDTLADRCRTASRHG